MIVDRLLLILGWCRRPWRVLPLLVLAACTTAAPPAPPSTVAPDGQAYQPGVSAIYCYRTLGGADCFREMQPGPPNRLINGWPDQTRDAGHPQ